MLLKILGKIVDKKLASWEVYWVYKVNLYIYDPEENSEFPPDGSLFSLGSYSRIHLYNE